MNVTDENANGARKPPAKLDDVLPVSLKIAGWTIPLVIGVVGVVKTISDSVIAAQREVRERAAAEIAFFDKQYDYATRLMLTPAAQDLLVASLDAMLERTQPDLSAGPLFDPLLVDQQERAMRQVCAARKTALSIYRKGASQPVVDYYAARLVKLDDAARRKPDSPAAAVMAYGRRCTELSADGPAPPVDPAKAQTPNPEVAAKDEAAPVPTPPPAPPPAKTDSATPPAKPPVEATPPTPRPSTAARALDCSALPSTQATTTTAPTVARQQKSSSGWRLDIFWCASASPEQERAHYAAACRAYNTLASRERVGDAALGRLQLRRLPVALQTGQGYPDSGQLVRYDAENVEEQLLADNLGAAVWPGAYDTQPAYTGARFYVSLFSCGRR